MFWKLGDWSHPERMGEAYGPFGTTCFIIKYLVLGVTLWTQASSHDLYIVKIYRYKEKWSVMLIPSKQLVLVRCRARACQHWPNIQPMLIVCFVISHEWHSLHKQNSQRWNDVPRTCTSVRQLLETFVSVCVWRGVHTYACTRVYICTYWYVSVHEY